MSTILVFSVSAAFIVLCALIIFREAPRSAIALARNDLFKARDQLFRVAQSGAVGFDHEGYRAARALLNGLIRYAHDLSLSQLVLTRVLAKLRGVTISTRDWDCAIASLPEDAKPLVQHVLDDAMLSMLRLMVTRSLLLSIVAVALGVVHTIGTALVKLGGRIEKAVPQEERAPETLFEDVLSHSPGLRFKKAVKQEARGYPTFGNSMLANAA
ncbi:hypothetical protein ACW5F0_05975 [Luteimonas sp. A534]